MVDATFKVYRYNPETDSQGHFQEFRLPMQRAKTVLDYLNEIKWYQDGTLTVRMSCRSAICGSCGININGHPKLACKTQAWELYEEQGDTITVEPMSNFEVIKDLVVDMTPFWEHIEAISPYVEPDANQPVPEKEYRMSPERFEVLRDSSACIMCGCCVAACTVYEVDRKFRGPAALAKAQRVTEDTRDGKLKERLHQYANEEGGIWDCVRCYECVEVCPKDVKPMEQIIRLRKLALEHGETKTVGARHVQRFTELIREGGILDERRLPLQSVGRDLDRILGMVPIGLKLMAKGKAHAGPPHVIPAIEEVRRIYHKLEVDQE